MRIREAGDVCPGWKVKWGFSLKEVYLVEPDGAKHVVITFVDGTSRRLHRESKVRCKDDNGSGVF
jgi:hypothetical protein